jgi:nickel/cobalt transporter (NicO) family protein
MLFGSNHRSRAVAARSHRRVLAALCLMIALASTTSTILAHPLDELAHTIQLTLNRENVAVQANVSVGPLVASRIWGEADTSGDSTISPDEAMQWSRMYLQSLTLRIDEQPLALTLDSATFPDSRNSMFLDSKGGIVIQAHAALPALSSGAHTIHANNQAYAKISTYKYSALAAPGVALREAIDVNKHEATFPLEFSATPAAVEVMKPAAEPANLAERIGDSQLVSRLREGRFSPGFLTATLLAALLFGALHALQPGHGKTLVAAYLVGSRGTIRHAITLGSIVTFTHTASVLALGTLLLAFSQTIKPERILPGLTAFSGLLVVGLGVTLLRTRLREVLTGVVGHHHHDHDHDHHHHHHDHDHDHHHHHDHDHDHHHHHHHHGHHHHHHHGPHGHSHELPERITPRSLIALGISGGIVPCTEALVILIVAVAVGQMLLGLLMIIAFSIGLAGVLIGIGVALVTVGGRLRDALPSTPRLAYWLPVLSAALVIGLGAALAWQGIAEL